MKAARSIIACYMGVKEISDCMTHLSGWTIESKDATDAYLNFWKASPVTRMARPIMQVPVTCPVCQKFYKRR